MNHLFSGTPIYGNPHMFDGYTPMARWCQHPVSQPTMFNPSRFEALTVYILQFFAMSSSSWHVSVLCKLPTWSLCSQSPSFRVPTMSADVWLWLGQNFRVFAPFTGRCSLFTLLFSSLTLGQRCTKSPHVVVSTNFFAQHSSSNPLCHGNCRLGSAASWFSCRTGRQPPQGNWNSLVYTIVFTILNVFIIDILYINKHLSLIMTHAFGKMMTSHKNVDTIYDYVFSERWCPQLVRLVHRPNWRWEMELWELWGLKKRPFECGHFGLLNMVHIQISFHDKRTLGYTLITDNFLMRNSACCRTWYIIYYVSSEQCSKSLYHFTILVGLWEFPVLGL